MYFAMNSDQLQPISATELQDRCVAFMELQNQIGKRESRSVKECFSDLAELLDERSKIDQYITQQYPSVQQFILVQLALDKKFSDRTKNHIEELKELQDRVQKLEEELKIYKK
jgi:hypothetical protein